MTTVNGRGPDVDALARWANVSTTTIRRLAQHGTLAAERRGRAYLFTGTRDQLVAAVHAQMKHRYGYRQRPKTKRTVAPPPTVVTPVPPAADVAIAELLAYAKLPAETRTVLLRIATRFPNTADLQVLAEL